MVSATTVSALRAAILSRLATLTLMLVFDVAVDDYDTSGSLTTLDVGSGGYSHQRTSAQPTSSGGGGEFAASCAGPRGAGMLDAHTVACVVCRHAEGLVAWDSVYFVQIALEAGSLRA